MFITDVVIFLNTSYYHRKYMRSFSWIFFFILTRRTNDRTNCGRQKPWGGRWTNGSEVESGGWTTRTNQVPWNYLPIIFSVMLKLFKDVKVRTYWYFWSSDLVIWYLTTVFPNQIQTFCCNSIRIRIRIQFQVSRLKTVKNVPVKRKVLIEQQSSKNSTKDFQASGEATCLQREHLALQNMKYLVTGLPGNSIRQHCFPTSVLVNLKNAYKSCSRPNKYN